MKNISFIAIDQIDELAWPTEHQEITKDSSALEIFTDFAEYIPLVIESSMLATEALALMQKAHVRLKLVLDENDHFIGVVSLDDLNRQELVKKLSSGYKREELLVTDFMRPRKDLKAFDYAELANTTIGTVINTLKNTGQQHCLVIDTDNHQIRGIISASDIARKLKLNIDIKNRSSFSHVFDAVG